MAVSATHLTTSSSGTGASSYATASISPTANSLVLAAVRANGPDIPATPTCSGASMTWVQVATITYAAARLTLFRGLSATPGSGALTFDFGVDSEDQCHWSINEFGEVNTSGTNGSGAVIQSATNKDGATTLTVTLSTFSSIANATYGVLGERDVQTVTDGTGFTRLAINSSNSRVIQTQWRNDNDTSVDWTLSSADELAGIAVEIASGFSPIVSDSISILDTATILLPFLNIDKSESITITESINMGLVDPNVSEAITITDTPIMSLTIPNLSVSDSVAITESTASTTNAINLNLSENITVTDTVSMGTINVSDSITVTESIDLDLYLNPNVSESITVTDTESTHLWSFPERTNWSKQDINSTDWEEQPE